MKKIGVLLEKILNCKLFRKIRFRLIASFMVPVAFILLLGVLSFSRASDGITSNYEKSTTQALNMAGKYLDFGFETVMATANQFINDDTLNKYLEGYYKEDRIEQGNKQKEIRNSFTTKETLDKFVGKVYAISESYDPISSNSDVANDTYQGFIETDIGQSVIENQYENFWIGESEYLDEKLAVSSDKYAIRLVRKIWKNNAILIIEVSMDTIKEVLRDFEFDKTGIVGFVTPDGKEIIATAKSGKVEVTLADKPIFSNNKFYKEALQGQEKEGSDFVPYKNKSHLFMYSKIGDTGVMLCGLVPKASIMSQADSIKNLTIVVALISIIVAVAIAIFISLRIDNAIKNIIAKLRVAAKGDLTVKFNIKRKDEFMTLIEELQYTFSNVKNLIMQVKDRSDEVSGSSSEVSKTAENLLKATEEISAAINQIESGITQQAKDAEECLNQMDNLSKKMLLVTESTKEISNIADNTKQSVQIGTFTTEALNTQTKETIRIAADIINEIQNLERKSSSIGEIINVINEIADQTNLLSLNASIEAARAGDAGRGFAVVASEIRKLADQSKESVNNIISIIEGIQEDTHKAVNIAREAEEVLRLQENAVSNTTQSYLNINDSVENLVVQLRQIIENVDNIEEARVSTLGAIESISAVLEEVAASANTVNHSAYEQLSSVDVLNRTANSLNNNAGVLVEAVEKFKV
ncbi:methyl-accepting chemotaxis protein [Herbinix luporum]|uniref:Methyl-accepting transducer domain-containing protein n=1 Tax=Herbinix luporum TaxID=1679721 RepID=A0A0K8J5P4_9FIRM|nr:methyl-accepting chemotaxis protein [Herbinix luporum]CUH92787.1 hypothetical protein SD1D_1241 [Herbinix luporum]